jgi:hypothetical protein
VPACSSGREMRPSRMARSCSASSMASRGSSGAGQPSRAPTRRFSAARQLGEVGKPSFSRTHRFERIEGGHARSGFVEIETGIREAYPPFCGAGGKRKSEVPIFEPMLVRGEVAFDLRAQGIEQDRLFDDLAREHLLREARHEDHVEAQSSRSFDRPHDGQIKTGSTRARYVG